MDFKNVVFIYTMEFYSQRRMKFCHLQVNGWNWRPSSKVKLTSLGGQKLHVLSNVEYIPNTNTAVL
jgi:hypothetical protein